MADKDNIQTVRFIEESGERFAVIPERQFRNLVRMIEDLKDSLEMKEALKGEKDFLTLDDLDEELTKAGLL